MKHFLAVLLGAVIAAAFLGPGTVTTAARAGAAHDYALLWTLVFATVACGVLQEAAARLTVVSGRNLGEALRWRFAATPGAWRGLLVLALAAGAVLLGCAAYEAGNILGGVAGARLVFDASPQFLTLLSAGAAGLLLWVGSTRTVVMVLSIMVAVMGAGFLITAVLLRPEPSALAAGLLVPRAPAGSGLLILALIGTTVVPYNLFLGSGIARGQGLGELRFGLAVAIGLGGVISMAVLVVGAALEGEFTYAGLAAKLAGELGDWAETFFAAGLFAAGFSSAITAPLAAAITARSLFDHRDEGGDGGVGDETDGGGRWAERAWRYRGVWLTVLAIGAGFGVADVRPIPAIVLAQALNGLLLPLVAIFLFLAVNDRRLLGEAINGAWSNTLMALVVAVTAFLGLRGFARAVASALGTTFAEGSVALFCGATVLILAWPVIRAARRLRAGDGA